MTPVEVFQALLDEFPNDVAVAAFSVHVIHMSIKLKIVNGKRTFTERLRNKSKKYLWRLSDAEFEQAFSIAMAIHEYSCRKEMQGIGGCTVATLRELTASSPTSSN